MPVVAWEWVRTEKGVFKKVYGYISGTSGTVENTGLKKIFAINITRYQSSWSLDPLVVEAEYGGDGGRFTLRVKNLDPGATAAAEDTTTTVTVFYEALGV